MLQGLQRAGQAVQQAVAGRIEGSVALHRIAGGVFGDIQQQLIGG